MKDLSLHILDIIENSANAGSKNIEINIIVNIDADKLLISIIDDGKGMRKVDLQKSVDPFTTTKKNKKIGLGIPLLKQAAESSNGKFVIESSPGKGTKVKALFQYSHVDRKPIGDIIETLISGILIAPETDFIFRYKRNGANLMVNTKELKNQIGIDRLTETNILNELKVILNNKMKELQE